MQAVKIYVIHVATQTERRIHVEKQFLKHPCLSEYHFMTKGNMDTISEHEFVRYFSGELSKMSPAVSCAYKHISCYRDLLQTECMYALIFEDDIFPEVNFCNDLDGILNEIKKEGYNNFLISLEDSNLKYVAGSERMPGKRLYAKQKGRMAGAYIVDRGACSQILKEIDTNTCHLPIDWFHNHCVQKGLFRLYWAHPTLAIQGSLNGSIPSLIDRKKFGSLRMMFFTCARWYKKLLYRFR